MKQIKHWVLSAVIALLACQSAFAQEAEFSNGEIDRMLAPIALYPDTVLTHILIAATYPLEVIQADRWVKDRKSLGGQAAVDGVSHYDWDPSVKALVAFPELLDRMASDLDWLQDLGEVFLANEGRVLDRVQLLREQAYAQGTLNDMQHLKVVRETRTIYIEPVEERVVYLPWYDPIAVYGAWHWPLYPPVVWRHSYSRHHGNFYWGPRYSLSTSFYFGAIAWPRHTVVILNRDHRPKRYWAHSIAQHQHAKRWRHDPYHRRHVAYRNDRVHRVFGDPRHDTHYQRPSLRQALESRSSGGKDRIIRRHTQSDRQGLNPRTPRDAPSSRYNRSLQGLQDRDNKVDRTDRSTRPERGNTVERRTQDAQNQRAQPRPTPTLRERLDGASERKSVQPVAPEQHRAPPARDAPRATPQSRPERSANPRPPERAQRQQIDRSASNQARESRAPRTQRSNARSESRRVERR